MHYAQTEGRRQSEDLIPEHCSGDLEGGEGQNALFRAAALYQ